MNEDTERRLKVIFALAETVTSKANVRCLSKSDGQHVVETNCHRRQIGKPNIQADLEAKRKGI